MVKGFDLSTPLTATKAAQFASAGYEFVCRYLAPQAWKSWKALTASEAQVITDAGMKIVSIWETTASAAGEGWGAGVNAGTFAVQAAREVGQTRGSKIYFAVDFEPATWQYQAIADYFNAVKETVGDEFQVDAYGCKAILDYLQSEGTIPAGWQTLAWSRGKKANNISIYQYDCGADGQGKMVNGIKVDLDESYGNEGWWNLNDVAEKLYDVYQGNNWLSDFYTYQDAVVEAQKWAGSSVRIKSNGDWAWTNVEQSYSFKDIESHWAKDDVTLLDSLGLLHHPDDRLFNPDKPITRAEVATLLARVIRGVQSGSIKQA